MPFGSYEAEWSAEWPIEPGWYWFYGKRSSFADKRDLFPVQVRQATNAMVYIASGAFLYAGEGARGVWAPMLVPHIMDYGDEGKPQATTAATEQAGD